ncbi:MAG: hypothetical protein WB755_28765 [Terriglobales bacterium]
MRSAVWKSSDTPAAFDDAFTLQGIEGMASGHQDNLMNPGKLPL